MAKGRAQKKDVDVQDLILEKDTGARQPEGLPGHILIYTALAWSFFQLWISSPLPFVLNLDFLIFDDTRARSIHLAFAMFLAYTAYPRSATSPRHSIPITDWLLSLVSAFCAGYLFLFYEELAMRPGLPSDVDIIVACIGMVLLLEAARRSLGMPLMLVGIVFLLYTFFGAAAWMPELISHKGQSFNKVASHQWLATEGVFGIALGVSTSFVFLFVLFGSLLDKAGAGNYFIKVAFALLGHLRGGPAKAAVLASGLTGFISGSSIANVVTTGTFTIPLMKRVGFKAEQAGAVEVSGSVNGQIMPPVMGAAAFLMVEYVGIPYSEVIKHALIPALISYIALLYIVHLEALKQDMKALKKPVVTTIKHKIIVWGIIVSSLFIVAGASYYAIKAISEVAGAIAPYLIGVVMLGVYVALIRYAAQYPDLEPDDTKSKVIKLPEVGPTVKTGLHYLIPVVVLIWCLMVERLSPGLSAFWACIVMMFILVTQRPIFHYFRNQANYVAGLKQGLTDLKEGLIAGARNMIGIGIATAAAGIIVGTVSLTGIGQIMTEIVEVLSGGSLMLVLIFTAIISLILGMGLPTTANYIVVSSIMVGVVQELGAQHGLIVPAIAIHLFVFYFGIMADVTPPVGLASFAAAAISKGDPIRTGAIAFVYSTRTAILPFFFLFNTDILLIDIDSYGYGLLVFVAATIGVLSFSAAMQNYFVIRSTIFESLLLLAVAVTCFIPHLWMDRIVSPFETIPGTHLESSIKTIEPGESIEFYVKGETQLGDPKAVYVRLDVGKGATAKEKLYAMGMALRSEEGKVYVDDVAFASAADRAGIFFDDEIAAVRVPKDQPNPYLMIIPALFVLGGVFMLQNRRKRSNMHR